MIADKVHTEENWDEMIAALNSGEIFECEESVYDYFLNVLPPVFMNRDIKLPNGEVVRADFGSAEGAEEIVAWWHRGYRYFGCRTNEINPYG